jgi:hypothetical protein
MAEECYFHLKGVKKQEGIPDGKAVACCWRDSLLAKGLDGCRAMAYTIIVWSLTSPNVLHIVL